MNKVLIIAKNTFLELVRDRIIYGIFVFAFLLVLMALVVAQLSYTEQRRILIDLGLAGLEISSIILSVFLGATIVFREVEKRTVLTLFARPISRGQFLVGKFFGLFSIVVLANTLLTMIFMGILLVAGWTYSPEILVVISGFIIESAALIAVTMVLGIIVRPNFAVPLSIGIFLIGRSMDSLNYFLQKSDSESFIVFTKVLNNVFLNFSRFDWKSTMVTESHVTASQFFYSFTYGFLWVLTLLSLSVILFKGKDIA